jgi:hypothetical protein
MKNIIEAKRYISNAKEILKEKAIKEDGFYKDRKYVKMAGHTAYAGVLVALDSILGDKRQRHGKVWSGIKRNYRLPIRKSCPTFWLLMTFYTSP